MKLNAFKMLPFAKELLTFLQEGVQDGTIIWNDLKPTINEEMIREKIAQKIVVKMVYWKPEYEGQELLDEQTRMAGARFLAGVVMNLVKDK
jgi:hypothetical protein